MSFPASGTPYSVLYSYLIPNEDRTLDDSEAQGRRDTNTCYKHTMAYGPQVPEEVLQRRQKRSQPTAIIPTDAETEGRPLEDADSSDDDDFGPKLTSNETVSEAEAIKRLEERSKNKTWENMDPSENPNRAGWMHNVSAELAGTFSSDTAQERAKEMMGFKK